MTDDFGRRALAQIEAGLPSSARSRALRVQSESGGRLDLIAAKLGLISDGDLASLYAASAKSAKSAGQSDIRPYDRLLQIS